MNRHIARIVIEAETPLAIGSDELNHSQDAPIDKDFNGLPYIPGTALAGAFRESLQNDLKYLFGNTDYTQPMGSNLIFSDALLYDGRKVNEALVADIFSQKYFMLFKELPIRPHAKHDYKGTATKGGLFDQEIVYKGSRFKFEISLESDKDREEHWNILMDEIQNMNLFLGSGQFRGYGLCKIVELKTAICNSFEEYTELSPSLNNDKRFTTISINQRNEQWQKLRLNTENSLFHFGSGYEDDDADAGCYKELAIIWNENNEPDSLENFVIPASSIKGALAHRVAYYYNKDHKIYIDDLAEQSKDPKTGKFDKEALEKLIKDNVGENNIAVKALFGNAKDSKTKTGSRGRVIFKDLYIPYNVRMEVKLMHNTIDRFTGGTLDTALFSEKAFYVEQLSLEYSIEMTAEEKYLQKALIDFKNGTLPLGGMAAKGHGIINAAMK
jgi:CRISPR/Cas system CSM-associated protein Csm3 (group 7 of RAMP superfamily)